MVHALFSLILWFLLAGRDSNVFEEDGEPVLGYPNGHRHSYGQEDPNAPHRVRGF